MQTTLGMFRAALLIGWVVLGAAGLLYAQEKGIPTWAAWPVLTAFLLEYPFYLLPGFEAARARLAAWPKPRLAAAMALSALPPYLVYGLGTGQFRWQAFLALAALALAVSFWYVLVPRSVFADLLLLALLASAVLFKAFLYIYPPPLPGLRIEVLGQVMLIRQAALAMLVLRGTPGVGFGFWPERREWWIGLRHYLYFLPLGFPLAVGLGLIRWTPEVFTPWKAAGTFFGILWVVALSEEFLFRGLLQQWFAKWTRSGHAALMLTSILFGLVHLPFRDFPNWRFALVAAAAGWFYGRAFREGQGIRAAMVSHALVVTTWRALFS